MSNKTFFGICFLLSFSIPVLSQTKAPRDSMPPHKNIVRANVTYPLLFGGKNLVLGYERVLTPHQSISLNIGRTSLPKIKSFDWDSLSVTDETKTSGYNLSLDYRFYLKKENKYLAPHGLYIGPYAFFYTFERHNDLTLQSNGALTELDSEMKLNIFGGGFELGYQFLFWKRVALDLVLIGPGIASYSFEAKLNGNLDIDEESEVVQAIKEWVDNKFPGSDFVWGDKSVNAKGATKTTSVGFRYMIQIGFNF
jgi:hypothetical protein